MLKVSASYLEKQKSFIPKKNIFLAVVNIKTKKLCLLTQFSGKVLLAIRMISHSSRLSETLSFEPSNSKRMPLNKGFIFGTLSRAQNSMYHLKSVEMS